METAHATSLSSDVGMHPEDFKQQKLCLLTRATQS